MIESIQDTPFKQYRIDQNEARNEDYSSPLSAQVKIPEKSTSHNPTGSIASEKSLKNTVVIDKTEYSSPTQVKEVITVEPDSMPNKRKSNEGIMAQANNAHKFKSIARGDNPHIHVDPDLKQMIGSIPSIPSDNDMSKAGAVSSSTYSIPEEPSHSQFSGFMLSSSVGQPG